MDDMHVLKEIVQNQKNGNAQGIYSVYSANEFVIEATMEKAFTALKESNPNAPHPVYIIGSEVPIPGGSQKADEIQVTKACATLGEVQK